MAEFEANQFKPDLKEELGSVVFTIVEALKTDPTSFTVTVQNMIHGKLIDYEEKANLSMDIYEKIAKLFSSKLVIPITDEFLRFHKITEKYLGVICMSSDFLDLTPRDNYIGWDRKRKTEKMINHTCIGSTIVPIQPLGYNLVGGKLLALLCLSDTVQKTWEKQYKDKLVGVTTTSLYGKTKQIPLSQYDRLKHWKKMGWTAGSVSFEPEKSTQKLIQNWLIKNHTRMVCCKET